MYMIMQNDKLKKQKDRQRDRWIDTQIDRQIEIDRQIDRQIDIQIDRQAPGVIKVSIAIPSCSGEYTDTNVYLEPA